MWEYFTARVPGPQQPRHGRHDGPGPVLRVTVTRHPAFPALKHFKTQRVLLNKISCKSF